MATTGEVRLDACELSKQMGGLLVLRCDVNLHTDILDTLRSSGMKSGLSRIM